MNIGIVGGVDILPSFLQLGCGLVFLCVSNCTIFAVQALVTNALGGTGQPIAKALAILSYASVVLAGTTQTYFLDSGSESVWALLEGDVDRMLAITADVVLCIETSDA